MNTLSINDISVSEALDRAAMTELNGGSAWHYKGANVYTGAWSGYTLMSKQYQGYVAHDGGYDHKYAEVWRRTRVQTEYSYWDHFV